MAVSGRMRDFLGSDAVFFSVGSGLSDPDLQHCIEHTIELISDGSSEHIAYV